MPGIDKYQPSRMTRVDFVDAFGGVYEHSPWVAERAFDNGLGTTADTAGGLSELMEAVVDAGPAAARLALLRAHPDLAGRLALAGGLTAESTSEQAGSGLDQCSPEEFETFRKFNTAYVTKFGFPFILAVRGHQRAEILRIFETRQDNDPETEKSEAMTQVHRIARLRIASLMP